MQQFSSELLLSRISQKKPFNQKPGHRIISFHNITWPTLRTLQMQYQISLHQILVQWGCLVARGTGHVYNFTTQFYKYQF